jgi:omega-6 fatty acid desaturase (delta-12 desaturase)
MTASIAKPQQEASSQLQERLRLKDIINTLPREVFLKDRRKAWTMVLVNVLLVALGYWGLAIAPWYLLPLVWVFTGTALTGFFVIGHDCGHRSFANRRWVNDLVGHLAFLPLIYPFHGWRHGHNIHHKHTNKIAVDTAWEPWLPEGYANESGFVRFFYRLIRGRFWWIGSIAHWAIVNFNWKRYEGKQSEQVKFSTFVIIGFSAIAFPLLFAFTGFWGVVKFWFIPWLVYHFWMSTFTIVHHTVPGIQFKPVPEWDEAEAQLSGTVHCDYPAWVEFLCHDINVHVPHHLSVAIPSYNLRKAHQFLRENWGEYLYETKFTWSLMKEITDKCHLYHPTECYMSFKEYREQQALIKTVS